VTKEYETQYGKNMFCDKGIRNAIRREIRNVTRQYGTQYGVEYGT